MIIIDYIHHEVHYTPLNCLFYKLIHFDVCTQYAGGGNGNPLQYSCLKNPRDCSLPGSLSTALQRVGYDWGTEHSIHFYINSIELKRFTGCSDALGELKIHPWNYLLKKPTHHYWGNDFRLDQCSRLKETPFLRNVSRVSTNFISLCCG